jgi:hypothetical protein
MHRRTAALAPLVAFALLRCGGSAGAPGGVATPDRQKNAPAAASATATSTTTDAAAAVAAVPEKQTAPTEKRTPFQLAAFDPPHERSAQPGDGQWVAAAEAGDADGEPLAYRTTVHPHGIRKDVYVAIIAFDLVRAELRWVSGTKEPESKSVGAEHKPGIVPSADRPKLIAAFNGGFMAHHGHYGAMIDGAEFLPPHRGACTIAIGKDQSVRIASWEKLVDDVANFSAYRQTPPCLVEDGALNPDLPNQHVKWGLSAEGKFEIRRSALGVDASGRVLYFGLGEWVLPREIAAAMKLAGAVSSAELDINWSYTRFNFYGKGAEGSVQVTGTLIPQLVHTKKSYVAEVAARDFFYVRRK